MEIKDVQATTKTEATKGVEKTQAPQKVAVTDGVSISKEAQFRAELVEQLKAMPELRPHEMAAAELSSPSLAAIADKMVNTDI